MQIIIYKIGTYFIGARWRFLVKTGNQSYGLISKIKMLFGQVVHDNFETYCRLYADIKRLRTAGLYVLEFTDFDSPFLV